MTNSQWTQAGMTGTVSVWQSSSPFLTLIISACDRGSQLGQADRLENPGGRETKQGCWPVYKTSLESLRLWLVSVFYRLHPNSRQERRSRSCPRATQHQCCLPTSTHALTSAVSWDVRVRVRERRRSPACWISCRFRSTWGSSEMPSVSAASCSACWSSSPNPSVSIGDADPRWGRKRKRPKSRGKIGFKYCLNLS